MKGWKRPFLWFYLLQKRLLKKKSFLIILFLVPAAVLLLTQSAKEDAGMLNILLCAEEDSGTIAEHIVDKLLEEPSVIHFERVNSPERAKEMVEENEADAVWIFQDDYKVTIVQAKEDSLLELTANKLLGEVFPYVSYDILASFLEEKIPGFDMTEEELRGYYETTRVKGSLFRFSYVNGEDATQDIENLNQQSYLLLPIRGLLALFVLLCGLAAAMFYMQDEKKKMFATMPIKHRYLFALGYHGIAVFDGAVATFAALLFTGTFTKPCREIMLMAVYGLLVTVFCNLLRMLCRKKEILGVLMPMLLLLSMAICPVFFFTRKLKQLQYLLPPYYYLTALHDNIILVQMLVCLGLFWFAGYLLGRNKG